MLPPSGWTARRRRGGAGTKDGETEAVGGSVSEGRKGVTGVPLLVSEDIETLREIVISQGRDLSDEAIASIVDEATKDLATTTWTKGRRIYQVSVYGDTEPYESLGTFCLTSTSAAEARSRAVAMMSPFDVSVCRIGEDPPQAWTPIGVEPPYIKVGIAHVRMAIQCWGTELHLTLKKALAKGGKG